jgi:hypothetical protein
MATTGHYYVSETGTIQQQGNAFLAAGLLATGWTGPFATFADAKAQANNVAKRIAEGEFNQITAGTSGGASAAGAAAGGGNIPSATASTNSCLLTIPLVGCVLTKTQGRAMIAGLIIGASGLVGLIGVMLIVAEGFRKTGAAHAAGGALETAGAATAFVPGLEGAGIALAATGSAARRAGSSSGASQSIQRRQGERESRRVAAAKAAETTAKGQTP